MSPLDQGHIVLILLLTAVSAYAIAGRRGRRQRMIEESQRQKDQLLAAVSHDLRTPLTTIKALAHDLSILGDERSEIIEQEADRLTRTVADLLDLSRLNTGGMPQRIELNAVDDLLGALMQRVETTAGVGRVHVALSTDDPVMVGHFDFVHTLRIVSNLVENALKYSPPDAPMDVAAARRDDMLVITVSDRGPGVAAAESERVFDVYYRAFGTPADVSGAGLGLSIARRLAEAQKGSLTYAARDGGGSVFTLTLPAAPSL